MYHVELLTGGGWSCVFQGPRAEATAKFKDLVADYPRRQVRLIEVVEHVRPKVWEV